MKAIFISILLSIISMFSRAQGYLIKPGEQFPAINLKNIINAPVSTVELSTVQTGKYHILNFWGTWCSPCIPEMDSLARLQQQNDGKIQVIAISNEETPRLQQYLKNKPSTIWLASDTSALLYHLFGFSYVGQSAVLDPNGKVLALLKTDSINQRVIDSIIQGEAVVSNADLRIRPAQNGEDSFGIDSTLKENFTLRSYMVGQTSMRLGYGDKSIYNGRRITFINTSLESIYTDAYNISSPKQLVYEVPEHLISNYEDKNSLYCLDLLIATSDKSLLYNTLREKLKQVMPVKVRTETREMPVYALVSKGFKLQKSTEKESSYSFSGMGYDGTRVTLADFADNYLSNEFELPVVDETGIAGQYDIKINVEMRTKAYLQKSLQSVGLDLVKTTKKMRVLVFYIPQPAKS